MFFDSWAGLLRVLIVGTAAYVSLILILRIAGKRTLGKLNAFDFVVTVALGSTLATVLLSSDVALAEGILALALLIGLQALVTWSSVRMAWVRRVVRAEPALLVRNGSIVEGVARRERVTEAEILQAARQQGKPDLSDVGAMILETDGTFSVIGSSSAREEYPHVHSARQERGAA